MEALEESDNRTRLSRGAFGHVIELKVVLYGGDSQILRIQQALELFAIVHQALGAHRAVFADQDCKGQTCDPIGNAHFRREHIRETLQLVSVDETAMLGLVAVTGEYYF